MEEIISWYPNPEPSLVSISKDVDLQRMNDRYHLNKHP